MFFFILQYFKSNNENGAAVLILDAFLRYEFTDQFSEDFVMVLRYWLYAIKDSLIIECWSEHWWIFLNEILTFMQVSLYIIYILL